MMKGIRLELIKTLGSKRFAISIFMIALGMLLNFITDSRYSRYTSVDVCLAAAFDKSFSLTILLLCVIPSGLQHCIEYNTGLHKYEVIRCGVKNYTISKTISAVVGGFLSTIVGMVMAIIEAYMVTMITNKTTKNIVSSRLAMEQEIWKILIYSILCAVIAQTAFTVSCYISDVYVTIIMPMLLYWAFNSVLDNNFPDFMRLSVIYYPITSNTRWNNFWIAFGYALLISLFLVLFLNEIAYTKIKRRMENGEDRGNGSVSVRRRPRPYDNAARAALPHRDGKEQFCPRPSVRRRCPAHACDATGGRADDRGGTAQLHPCVCAASERGGGKTGDAGAVGGSICRGAGCRGMLNGRQALLCVRSHC